jgi:hypothetical protein
VKTRWRFATLHHTLRDGHSGDPPPSQGKGGGVEAGRLPPARAPHPHLPSRPRGGANGVWPDLDPEMCRWSMRPLPWLPAFELAVNRVTGLSAESSNVADRSIVAL